MKEIKMMYRDLSPEEVKQVNGGFDQLAIQEGMAIESTQRMSFAAMLGDQFIGCSTGLAHKNGDNYSGWFHLTDLFIDKEFRNQGIGSKLLKELEKKIKTIGVQNIWLWTSGAPSLRFYKRLGYIKFAEKENWYSDGSSRIGLRKTFHN